MSHRPSLRFSAALVALLAVPTGHAQTPPVDLERRLTPEQMRATGLDRLSAAELALLNRLLREDRADARHAEAVATAGLRTAPERAREVRVESALSGEFRGWSPGTVLQLQNGQQWRVLEGELHTKRMTSPNVTVEPGFMGAWYLRVEGQMQRAKVRRIR